VWTHDPRSCTIIDLGIFIFIFNLILKIV
jgi:hypothetical protein